MVQQRQLLDGQLNENKSVLEELNRLNEDKNTVSQKYFRLLGINRLDMKILFKVYKIMGPILVKQSLSDSQQNITKRIDFIGKELQKCNDRLNGIETSQEKYRENLGKLQQQLSVLSAMK